MKLLGCCPVEVQLYHKIAPLYLHVVQGKGASLLGREWFQALDIRITGINTLTPSKLDGIMKPDGSVFDGLWDKHTSEPLKVHLQLEATPKFLKREVPLPRTAMHVELDPPIEA